MTTAVATRPAVLATMGEAPSTEPADPMHCVGRVVEALSALLEATPTWHGIEGTGVASAVGRLVGQSLDALDALLHVGPDGIIDYHPRRGAGAAREDADVARAALDRLRQALPAWSACPPDTIVRVERGRGPLAESQRTWSTLGTEAALVVNQVVDRQRIIRHLLESYGFGVPECLGVTRLPPLRARGALPPHWALWRLLDEMGSLVRNLPPDVYRARPAARVSGSIGEHVRHALDHVAALVTADSDASVALSYDGRRRKTAVENQPAHAADQIAVLKARLGRWAGRPLDEPLRVRSMVSETGDAVTGWSSRARELAFVVSHTIHHHAMIGLLLAMHGRAVPARFGLAPSTPTR